MVTTLWFIHVPRTGGTSIDRFKDQTKKIKIVSYGHQGYCPKRHKQLQESCDNLKIITVLRDPVEHASSLYSFIKKEHGHQKHKTTSKPFSKWVKTFDEMPNYYCNFFSKQNHDADFIISRLNFIDYVLDTKTLSEGMNKILWELGEPARFTIHVNGFKKAPVSEEDVTYIKKARSQDYKLLEHFKIPIIH